MPSWKHVLWQNCDPTAREWSSIITFYSGLVEHDLVFEPVAELAIRLARSPYADAGLAALTSMHDLIIGPSRDILGNPHLRIAWDFDRHEFRFTYEDGSRKPWQRSVAREESFAVLEHFLTKRARWYQMPHIGKIDPKKVDAVQNGPRRRG